MTTRLASNDRLLATLGPDRMLRHLLGLSPERFSADAGVRPIAHCTPAACGDEISRMEREGWRSFSVEGDVLLPARTFGSTTSPVAIVAKGSIGFAGASVVHGLVLAASSWPASGPGRGRIVGAAVAGLDADRPALDSVAYDVGVLARLRASGPLLRVPGSWSDE